VILSGGSGTRLWPLSRRRSPKQLLAMVDERTMLRATFDRLEGIPELTDPWVVCNADHRQLVARELFDAGFRPGNIILEPVGRNTAPAAAAAALVIAEQDPDALMLVLPADHVIEDEAAFQATVAAAVGQSGAGMLATFGIVPTYPETGYGYIEVGEPLAGDVSRVAEFVEKPDAATAESYLAAGNYLWNSGMFLFTARRYLEELGRFAPQMVAAVRKAVPPSSNDDPVELDDAAFRSCPSDSIDFAVMEKTDAAVVVPLDAGWSDVGSWAALWELAADQGEDNVFVGDVAAVDVAGSYLRAESRLVAAIGVKNLVVVETPDAVMVAPRHRSQDVKTMVELLKKQERSEAEEPPRRLERWGTSELLYGGELAAARLLTFGPTGAEAATLPAAGERRTWHAVGGSGIVEVAGRNDDKEPGPVEIPPGISVAVRVPGPDTFEVIEIITAV